MKLNLKWMIGFVVSNQAVYVSGLAVSPDSQPVNTTVS